MEALPRPVCWQLVRIALFACVHPKMVVVLRPVVHSNEAIERGVVQRDLSVAQVHHGEVLPRPICRHLMIITTWGLMGSACHASLALVHSWVLLRCIFPSVHTDEAVEGRTVQRNPSFSCVNDLKALPGPARRDHLSAAPWALRWLVPTYGALLTLIHSRVGVVL